MTAFRMLARLKRLRGTVLDVFGYSAERRLERRLLADYESDLALIVETLDAARIEAAAALASVPALVRGYGHVKAGRGGACRRREGAADRAPEAGSGTARSGGGGVSKFKWLSRRTRPLKALLIGMWQRVAHPGPGNGQNKNRHRPCRSLYPVCPVVVRQRPHGAHWRGLPRAHRFHGLLAQRRAGLCGARRDPAAHRHLALSGHASVPQGRRHRRCRLCGALGARIHHQGQPARAGAGLLLLHLDLRLFRSIRRDRAPSR